MPSFLLIVALALGVGQPDIELFTRAGCPHCVEAKAVLDDLACERPELIIVTRDVGVDVAARERLRVLAADAGITAPGVPAFHVRGQLLVGMLDREATATRLRAMLDSQVGAEEGSVCAAEEEAATSSCAQPRDGVTLPLVGEISASRLGLPLFTIILGAIDGFNPCATWVLLFLLALLVNLKSRRRMALVGGTFVAMSGFVYFAFMAAWLNFFLIVGLSRAVTLVLGIVAVLVGGVNVKDFFAFGKGVSLSIPDAAKPKIYARARKILSAENLAGALVAATALAFLVNLVELLCTAGLPAIYTAVLAGHPLSKASYYGYLALYNIVYMLDDSILLVIAVITLSKRKLQESGGRLLKLLSGMVMLILGVILLVAPRWLGW